MKIYRIMDRNEYASFSKYKNITNYHQAYYNPSGMLFPENIDKYGKFFFFEIEDVYNFVHNFSNATSADAILELEVDRETALKYLLISDYYYFDPNKKSCTPFSQEEIEKKALKEWEQYISNHEILELYIDHDLVNSKIQNGEYRIIPGPSLLEYENCPAAYYESIRNPKTLELARRLKNVREARQNFQMTESRFRTFSFRYSKLISGKAKPTRSEKKKLDYLQTLKEKLAEAVEDTKSYFIEFAREHEKYMALVPAPEESQPEK